MSPAATATLRLSVVKEARALLPTWVACAVTMGVAATSFGGRFDVAGLAAYAIGAAALGAISIGHEYGHHTVATLLSQPVSRARILAVKFGVLAILLVSLAALALALLDVGAVPRAFRQDAGTSWLRIVVALLPVCCGLLLAPWLTMLCRSTLAGFVFALAFPAGLTITGTLVGMIRFGHNAIEDLPLIYGLTLDLLWRGTLAVSAIAALMGWRTFMHLQAVDGPVDHIAPSIARSAVRTARRQSALWLLVKKELRCQQTTFVFAALYLGYWLIVATVRIWVPAFLDPSLFAVTLVYGGSLALLIGSLGSAEERHAGTLEWQTLLPMAAWKQWIVKIGTLLGLALALTVGLPLLLAFVHSFPDLNLLGRSMPPPRTAAALVAAAVSISLYISTLSDSSVKSLLISLAVIAACARLMWFVGAIQDQVVRAFAGAEITLATMRQWAPSEARDFISRIQHLHSVEAALTLMLMSIVVGLVLWFAHRNHQSADRGGRRTLVQAGSIAGSLLIGSAVVGLVAVALAGAVRWPSHLR